MEMCVVLRITIKYVMKGVVRRLNSSILCLFTLPLIASVYLIFIDKTSQQLTTHLQEYTITPLKAILAVDANLLISAR